MPGTACSRASTPPVVWPGWRASRAPRPKQSGRTGRRSQSSSRGPFSLGILGVRVVVGAQPVTLRSAREDKRSQVRSRGHRRRRVDRADRSQCPAHPGHCGVRVVTEFTGHPHSRGLLVAAWSPRRRRAPGREDDPEGCRVDANSASARAATNVPGPSQQGSDVFIARILRHRSASLPFASAARSDRAARLIQLPGQGRLRLHSQRPTTTTGEQESADSGQQQEDDGCRRSVQPQRELEEDQRPLAGEDR